MHSKIKYLFTSCLTLISLSAVVCFVILMHGILYGSTNPVSDGTNSTPTVSDDQNHYDPTAEPSDTSPTPFPSSDNQNSNENDVLTPPPGPTSEVLINAYKIIVDGTVVAIVPDELEIDDIIEQLQQQYEAEENLENTIIEINKEITVEKIQTYSHNLTDEDTTIEAIADCISFKINAFELSVDGLVIGYFETEDECIEILKSAKDKYIQQKMPGKDVLDISYDRDFDIVSAEIYKEDLENVTYSDAVDIIISDRKVEKYITVTSADELKEVFDNSQIFDLLDYNELLDEIRTNGEITVTVRERLVNFRITVQYSTVTSIAFSTQYKTNTSLSHKTSNVIQKGVAGTKTQIYSQTYLNEECLDTELTLETTVNPVAEIIEYGTKIGLRETVVALTGKGYFMWPSTGFITNLFAFNGSIGHTGIDIANVAGTPIYACADGYVDGVYDLTTGYGKYVVISHDNGYQTYYAHMSKYIVSKGQYIKQGQIIGYVGMTGDATGNHCHLSIYKDGVPIDPTTMLYGY